MDEELQALHEGNEEILSLLHKLLLEGKLGIANKRGMITSYLAIIELIDEDGNSRIQPMFSDGRSSVLLGLLEFAKHQIHHGIDVGTGPDRPY